MIWLRSILFNLFFFTWTGILLFSLWILMPLSPSRFRAALRLWPGGVLFGLKWLVGITYEVRGRENLRSGAVVFAAKHQSVWETMLFLLLDGEVAYTMKTELLRIPFWGWYMKKAGNVALDRTGGAAALRRMIREAKSILEEGRSVVIFPEGTRVKPGEKGKYQAGIAALYAQTGVPVVPVALNSGLFWGRHSFRKRPGTILLEFLEPLPPGLERAAFMDQLERRVESAAIRLFEEGGGKVD